MTLRFAKLDRPAIRALKPGEQITEHGITAARTAGGDVRYSINVMVDGCRIHRVIGTESARVTRTQCEDFIEQARTDSRAKRLNLPQGRKLALTFTAAAVDYLKRLDDSAGKNIKIKRRQLTARLKPFFGAMRLDGITAFTIDRYKKHRLGEGAANGTINRELATLSHLFSMAVEWKWIERVPARPKMLRESAGRIIALSEDQCDSLMRAAMKSADAYCWLFVSFGLNTAMRHAEILAARFDQLDMANHRLFIPEAKAGQREQPITPELVNILINERGMCDDSDGWIFPSLHKDSGTGHRARMDKPFRDAVIAAKLDPTLVTPHVMRHTAITALVKAGVDLPTVQKISGHKTLAMVLRYAHVHGDHIDKAMKSIGRALPKPRSDEEEPTAAVKGVA